MGLFSRSTNTAPTGVARTVSLVKDSSGAPAVDLTKASNAGHVDLVKRAQKAGISLSKRGLAGIRAQAVLVLDHSGSMYSDYKSGKVQTLVERVLGFALQIDVDGVVPVIPFDANVRPTVNVGLAASSDVVEYRDVVNRHIWQRNMGSTNLTAALQVVRGMATTTDAPIFCVVVTDGSPDNRRTATELVVDLARYPVFVKFLAIRDVPYLRELDDMPDGLRLLDNVDSKAFADPAAISDLVFADAMADEWDTWVAAATAAGVLR